MAERKIPAKLKNVFTLAKPTKRFFVLNMPNEVDSTPHWLFWLMVAAGIVLVGSIIYYRVVTPATIQAFLPTV